MNTPTEAHLDLALQIAEALARSGNVAAAELIADSEARAIAKQVEALAILTLRWDKVEKERDQLRARAERAEAELAKERARLEWLEKRGPWESWNVPCGEAEITLRGPIRAAIDAAMREETK